MANVLGGRSNLLITYIEDYSYFDEGRRVEHLDPTFEREWSYCTGNRALLKCGRNNYVFFHATKKDPITNNRVRFITAYFMIKAVGLGKEIVPIYNVRGPASHAEEIEDHYVIVGDEKLSKKLKEPGLRFDRNLAERLVFNPPKTIRFDIANRLGRRLSELECIAYSTRSIRVLSDEDVNALLREIDRARL